MMLKQFFMTAAEAVIDFIFAPRCAVCGEYIENRRDMFCPHCRANIIAVERAPDVPKPLTEVWRLTRYREGSRDLLRAIKFNEGRRADELNQLSIIHAILEKAFDRRLQTLFNRIDFATPVPLHKNRQSERGFNQVELIFGDWLNSHGVAVENILRRDRDTKHLFDLNRAERQSVLAGAFSIVDGVSIVGKNILLLDDIYTTGTTMSECALTLQTNGAGKIFGLALASDFD